MTASFRARILLLVLAVAVLPMGLIGLWLTGGAARSGEALLRSRLESALDADARAVELSWLRYRSALLDLSESRELQGALRAPAGATSRGVPTQVQAGFASLEPAVEGMIIRDRAGRELWRLGRLQADPGGFLAFGALLSADVPLFDVSTGEPLGRIEAFVPINALRPASATAAAISAVITARDPVTGALLLPAPFDPSLLAQERFQWNAEDWMVVRRAVSEPSVELIASAPVAPFAAPFRGSARRGSLVLLIVAALGLWTAVLITARLTRSLEDLAAAAGDVAGGHLGRRVDVRSDDEIGRVARAFNAMTDSLRRTLDQLAERESLAAVNEFAAALAHEIRNPLSAIQLDLQEVEEQLPQASTLRALQARALGDVRRLERTVAGALATARSGRIEPRRHDLIEPLRAAVRVALPRFREREATLDDDGLIAAEPLALVGDPDALQQAFLNLLLNAADALAPGGSARITCARADGNVMVHVHDNGEGIAPERLPYVFDAFHTSRPGGTGVGLAVARRIVVAHGGTIRIDSTPAKGTTVEIQLPLDD